MAENTDLNTAKKNKADEFYTMFTDIEKEMENYKDYFKGKTIYLNCDDTNSNFYIYFCSRFSDLKLNKLISTHYEANKPSMKTEMTEGNIYCIPLKGNGDFRSDECIEILKQADIVITNPPFSLFREYYSLLKKHGKEFIVLGNMNAITYKEMFKDIRDNKLWLGQSIHSGDREYKVPNDYPLNASGFRVDEQGNHYIRVKGIRWFTNIDYKDRHKPLELTKTYYGNEDYYSKYDNYDAININKTKEIPMDYDGIMGVPLSALDYLSPDQFTIVGGRKGDIPQDSPIQPVVNGERIYRRILIIKN